MSTTVSFWVPQRFTATTEYWVVWLGVTVTDESELDKPAGSEDQVKVVLVSGVVPSGTEVPPQMARSAPSAICGVNFGVRVTVFESKQPLMDLTCKLYLSC